MRKNCRQPNACIAGARGPCRLCSDMSVSRERMKALHADPEFAAANAERMKKRHADPEFAAAHAERMKKLNAHWTGEMDTALIALRRARVPMIECAERIGISYYVCRRRCVELGVAP